MSHAPSRYQIVPRRTVRRWPLVVAVSALWLSSLGLAWRWAGALAAPALADTTRRMHDAEQQLASQRSRLRELSQRETTLSVSDKISREANGDLQGTLAERDEEISALRADVAFYERLVGPTQQRKGLNVFSSEFSAGADAAWQYQIVLTQNLNRGAVNTGRVTLSIEGTRDDRLEKLSWSGLRKQGNAPGVPYSFKYFQQVEGDLVLPAGVKPVRVIARLVPASGAPLEQGFTWGEATAAGPAP